MSTTRTRLAAAAVGAVVGSLLLGAASCTVWNGLSVDALGDASIADTGAVDAAIALPPRLPDGGAFPAFFANVDQAVQLCSALASCAQLGPSLQFVMGLPVQQSNFSACVDLFAGPRPVSNAPTDTQRAMLAAVLAAKTCAAQLDLLPYELITDGSPLCADGGAYCVPSPTKSGTTDTVSCDEGVLYHCASAGFVAGSMCDTTALDCVTPDPCGVGGACQGNFQRTCDTGEARDGGRPSEDCTLFGAKCDDVLGCALGGRPATCNTAAAFACSGATISACIATNPETIYCPELGATCDDSHTYAFCSLPGGCTPFSAGVNQCASDGSTISLCIGGVIQSYNCSNVGLQCKSDANFLASCTTP